MSAHAAGARVRGLYAITPDTVDTADLTTRVGAALAGGVRLVQYRNKCAGPALRLEQARALKALCASRAALIVNDDVDIALAVDADGVHLGADDGLVTAARDRLGRDKLIGVSCYDSLERAHEAGRAGADHVAFGSFFASPTKPGAVRAPVTLLERAKRETGLPVVAIGGITLDNGAALVRAGADALAVISALFGVADIEARAVRFSRLFDTPA